MLCKECCEGLGTTMSCPTCQMYNKVEDMSRLPVVTWTKLNFIPLSRRHRFRYWLGNLLESWSWKLRDGI